MRSVRIHQEADRQIIDASKYLESQRESCGEEFLSEIAEAFRKLAARPELWNVQMYGYRKYVVQRFGYLLWYRENKSGIYIIAVHHSARKPGYWKNRILDDEQR